MEGFGLGMMRGVKMIWLEGWLHLLSFLVFGVLGWVSSLQGHNVLGLVYSGEHGAVLGQGILWPVSLPVPCCRAYGCSVGVSGFRMHGAATAFKFICYLVLLGSAYFKLFIHVSILTLQFQVKNLLMTHPLQTKHNASTVLNILLTIFVETM